MLVFAGSCTRCGDAFTWSDLSQQLSCLEAKNKGTFGECNRGVAIEEHEFDQECDACASQDEGVGDLEDEDLSAIDGVTTLVQEGTLGKRTADEQEESSGDRKKQKV